MEYAVRKHPRLKEYDYSQPGCYFLTFCVKNHECCLGTVGLSTDGTELPKVTLTEWGKCTKKAIEKIPLAYQNVTLDCYAIMPNHVHLLVTLGSEANTSIPMIIRAIKTAVTRTTGKAIWQESYHDHVIRDRESYLKIWDYVNSNAAKWMYDRYYRDET